MIHAPLSSRLQLVMPCIFESWGALLDSAYKYFYSLVLTGIAALCYRVLLLAPEWAKDPQYGGYVYTGVAAVLWFLFAQSRNIASLILAILPNLRRTLAWNNFIEGDWPLVVIDRTNGQLLYYGS